MNPFVDSFLPFNGMLASAKMEFGILRAIRIMYQKSPTSVEPKIALMIIGAQKAGTTSMKNYLGQHPSLQTHPHKEFSYFFDTDDYEKGYAFALKKYFNQKEEKKLLLAKNAGLYISKAGIKRLKAHNPDCKLVMLLRNPVERTYSSYLMEKNYGTINGSFEDIGPIARNGNLSDWRYEFFIGMSLYHTHLVELYRHFSHEQVKLIRYEDFQSQTANVCQDIFQWAGIDAGFIPDTSTRYNVTQINRSPAYGRFVVQMLRNQNPLKKIMRSVIPGKMDYKFGEMLRNINKTSKTYGPVPQNMLEELSAFYAPYNEKLSILTGIDFSDWSKIR